MQTSAVSTLGLAVLPLYFLLTIVIGRIARRPGGNTNDYLNASRSLPLWIVSASFLAANCGALEVIGLSAVAAEFGVQAFHFYWIGAIPGMIFLAMWMMPVYIKSKVYSVPQYLEDRYSLKVRLLNAYVTAIMMLLLSGISLYAMAQVLHVVLGVGFAAGTLLSAAVVLSYVLLGGVRATIYNEVFLLFVMLAGLVPLFIRSFKVALVPVAQSGVQRHLWQGMPLASHTAPFDAIGVVFGLGFVLSFSYWGTDFVLIQRTLASRTEAEARQAPLWAGFGKLAFSLIVVLPGLAAQRVIPHLGTLHRYDQALPLMMRLYYGPTMLGVGFTAITASLMSGLAANVSAFAAIWTEDIYRAQLQPGKSDRHYMRMGYSSTAAAILFAVVASSISFYFGNLMDHVQLIFSIFSAPFWAIFLLGMSTRKTTAKGALAGFLIGAGVAVLDHLCVMRHWISYGSLMNANFHAAIHAFITALAVALLVSTGAAQPVAARAPTLVFHWRAALRSGNARFLILLSLLLLLCCALLNAVWR